MAKRRRRGLGWLPEKHSKKAKWAAGDVADQMRRAKYALQEGDCREAFRAANAVDYHIGRVHAHLESREMREGREMPDEGSEIYARVFGKQHPAMLHAKYKLQEQIERKCVLPRSAGVNGLGDGCRDSSGNFIPVPACMGRHVQGSKRKSCPHGVNKRTGKCLKRPRRK